MAEESCKWKLKFSCQPPRTAAWGLPAVRCANWCGKRVDDELLI